VQYLYLSELNGSYRTEEGSSGDRILALTELETKLKKAIADYNNAVKLGAAGSPVAPVLPRGPTNVARLVAFHETAQQKAGPNPNLAKVEAKIKKRRAWLKLQNCVVKADGSIDWGLSNRTVEYDHQLASQGMTRLWILGGRLFRDSGGTQPLDTDGMVTHFSGPGHAIYVMSAQGNLHVSSHSVGHRHHSSLLAGANVAGAGELKASNGHLKWLSNKSGHYRPSVVHLLQTLHQLQKAHLPMTFALTVLPDEERFCSVGAFLQHLELNGQPDYELMKLMMYAPHLTDEILCTHLPNPWRWVKEGETGAVYDDVTKQPVPHKMVREWLKSKSLKASPTSQHSMPKVPERASYVNPV